MKQQWESNPHMLTQRDVVREFFERQNERSKGRAVRRAAKPTPMMRRSAPCPNIVEPARPRGEV